MSGESWNKLRTGDRFTIRYDTPTGGMVLQHHVVTHTEPGSISSRPITFDEAMDMDTSPPILNWNRGYPFWEDRPSIQGPCKCPEGAVMADCPRCGYMFDYVGQPPFSRAQPGTPS